MLSLSMQTHSTSKATTLRGCRVALLASRHLPGNNVEEVMDIIDRESEGDEKVKSYAIAILVACIEETVR